MMDPFRHRSQWAPGCVLEHLIGPQGGEHRNTKNGGNNQQHTPFGRELQVIVVRLAVIEIEIVLLVEQRRDAVGVQTCPGHR